MRAFSSLHPAVSMLHFAAVVAVGMFSTNPVIEVLSLAGGALFCATLTSPEQKKKDAVFYVFMMLAVVITNPLFSHNGVTELLFINGNPITLYEKNKFIQENLTKARVSTEDVEAQVRINGYANIKMVDKVILERTGKMSVLPKDSPMENQSGE